MKALRHSLKSLLTVTGSIGLAVLAIPVIAVLAVVLRVALLLAIPLALVTAGVLWMASVRFRVWLRTSIEPDDAYKGLRLAHGVALDEGHAWVRTRGSRMVVGADDLLAAVIGPIERVDLPPAGQEVHRGDVLFRLKRGERTLDVRAPVSGMVMACNDALAHEPTLVNADPFHRGWTVKLREAPGLDRDDGQLRSGRDVSAWFRAEVDRLLTAVLGDVGTVPAMADGGVVDAELYRRIDERGWQQVTAMVGGTRS